MLILFQVKPKFRQSLQRPYSVRRRLTTASNLPKYSSTNIEKITTTPLLDETYTNLNRRINRVYPTTTLKTATHRPTHKFHSRRAFVRPENRRSTTIDTTPFESTTFRYTFKTSTNAQFTTLPTTTVNIDQEAGSSIQDSKFTKNKFTTAVRNDDGEENKAGNKKEISKLTVPNTITTTQTPQYTKLSTSSLAFSESKSEKILTSTPKNNRPKTKEHQKILKTINIQEYENNNKQFSEQTYRPIIDYDYYDEEDVRVVSKKNSLIKVILHSHGKIECLDQGNFPHPLSCRKFISCAKMGKAAGRAIGWEYTCPKGLSYDPVGGICNWSSGLGCKE